jgi:hypothetical protein
MCSRDTPAQRAERPANKPETIRTRSPVLRPRFFGRSIAPLRSRRRMAAITSSGTWVGSSQLSSMRPQAAGNRKHFRPTRSAWLAHTDAGTLVVEAATLANSSGSASPVRRTRDTGSRRTRAQSRDASRDVRHTNEKGRSMTQDVRTAVDFVNKTQSHRSRPRRCERGLLEDNASCGRTGRVVSLHWSVPVGHWTCKRRHAA